MIPCSYKERYTHNEGYTDGYFIQAVHVGSYVAAVVMKRGGTLTTVRLEEVILKPPVVNP